MKWTTVSIETCSDCEANQGWVITRVFLVQNLPVCSCTTSGTCICQKPGDSCRTEMISCKIDAAHNGLFKIAAAPATRGPESRAKIWGVSQVALALHFPKGSITNSIKTMALRKKMWCVRIKYRWITGKIKSAASFYFKVLCVRVWFPY